MPNRTCYQPYARMNPSPCWHLFFWVGIVIALAILTLLVAVRQSRRSPIKELLKRRSFLGAVLDLDHQLDNCGDGSAPKQLLVKDFVRLFVCGKSLVGYNDGLPHKVVGDGEVRRKSAELLGLQGNDKDFCGSKDGFVKRQMFVFQGDFCIAPCGVLGNMLCANRLYVGRGSAAASAYQKIVDRLLAEASKGNSP